MKPLFFFLSFIIITVFSYGQNFSKIREYTERYTTYPFSDPNPIPVFGKIYPYYRFDGYTINSKKKEWRIVELENDYLRIKIFPQIGGKIWSVVDKTNGKELFYGNDVVKFRDISLRGPWTSGGVEFNYGIVGHSPSCSFPIDYITKKNNDGSVSCFIGMLDLLTRTRWAVEINLPMDKGWFTTRSVWHNATSISQPYYNWVNAGVLAKEDLEFIYSGKYIVRHDGIALPWPLDSLKNKNLARWAENDFVGSKSYHIVGTHSPFWGAYWASEDYGMMHYADREEKLGRKIFSWALSDQGKIWEELLTDHKGQYVELQSGRLFNQNMIISSLTPFKQITFMPYSTDVWCEYWFPYKGTKGVSNVTLEGVVNVNEKNGMFTFNLSPLYSIKDTLKFYNVNKELLFQEQVTLGIGQPHVSRFYFNRIDSVYFVTLQNKELWSKENVELKRPVSKNDKFNWNTAQGQYFRGRDLLGLRIYDQAETFIRKSLEYDEYFIPSLTEMSRLFYNKMNYDSAFFYAYKALTIDTYDPAANFEYGKAALKLKQYYDALDGFEVASLSSSYRCAALTEIAKIYVSKNEYAKAIRYAEKSLMENQYNIESLQLLCLLYKLTKCEDKFRFFADQIKDKDPLNHFVQFEEYLENTVLAAKEIFCKSIKCEMPEQIYLELGIWYNSLGLKDRAVNILTMAPLNPEIKYWVAYLNNDRDELLKAEQLDPSFVFPFREESEPVFNWAVNCRSGWKSVYYLSLINIFRNNKDAARKLLLSVMDKPDFAPFYIIRSQLSTNEVEQEADIQKAISLDSKEWRYVHQLTRLYLDKSEVDKALSLISLFYNKNSSHFPTAILYIRALIRNKQYKRAEKVLEKIRILPFEGSRDGRLLYEETKLMLAVQALNRGNLAIALRKIEEANRWPRNLGVGKPYEELIDSRLEDWLSAMIYLKLGNQIMKKKIFQKIAIVDSDHTSINTLLQCISLYQLDKLGEAEQLFHEWEKYQTSGNVREWGKAFYQENREKNNPFDYKRIIKIIGLISRTEDMRFF
ncbi:DUF5107 domain-containing protein [Parabacteroides sp. Marseille-P3160]|uniref:DUF5107 domain-containing protein n=1 Tax=Parabacteroides sp. Marseille-P3160 TaxID=1917887 RepID=UPI0009BAE4A1|nr:DUF5107 domain-containing protein [Parabacteroides sp. Marseille-P3160]